MLLCRLILFSSACRMYGIQGVICRMKDLGECHWHFSSFDFQHTEYVYVWMNEWMNENKTRHIKTLRNNKHMPHLSIPFIHDYTSWRHPGVTQSTNHEKKIFEKFFFFIFFQQKLNWIFFLFSIFQHFETPFSGLLL